MNIVKDLLQMPLKEVERILASLTDNQVEKIICSIFSAMRGEL